MTKVDDDIRDACAALERAVPEDYFDTLGGRIAARLDGVEPEGEAMGPNMTTDGGKRSDMPPPAGQPSAKREENTGLHDIKAMATSTKKRISRRMTTESDHEESLLASASSASLAAVVLPEPGKDKEHYAGSATATSPAAMAAAAASAVDAERSGGVPLWLYGVAGAAVAAAAVIFFLARSGHQDKTEVAQSEAATAPAPADKARMQPEATPLPEPTASSIPQASGTAAAAADTDTDSAKEAAPSADPGSEAPADDNGAVASNAAVPAKADKKAEHRSHVRRSSRQSAASSSSSRHASRPATKASHHTSNSHASKSHSETSKNSDGKRSLDDLLNEASGGAVANKDVAPAADKPAEPKKPSKTELSRSDITTGMKKVTSRVNACYGKFQKTGTVMIKVVIAPSGHVSSASATGTFKGTDTGACVAKAVEKAKFPAWDGNPQHINYPFLLSP